jgi:hypothetical protein
MTPVSSSEFTGVPADICGTGMSRRGVIGAGALVLGLGAAGLAGATTPALAAESSDGTGVRPFRVRISGTVLADLRRRTRAGLTRRPSRTRRKGCPSR